MTNWREIEKYKHDPGDLAKLLLKTAVLTDWEEPFLEKMAVHQGELSTRQAEKLLEIRDDNLWVGEIRGFSVRLLLKACWEGRHDLHTTQDFDFIEKLKARGEDRARYREARHLLDCARDLHVIDD